MEDYYKRKMFNDEKLLIVIKKYLTEDELKQFANYINKVPLSRINKILKNSIDDR